MAAELVSFRHLAGGSNTDVVFASKYINTRSLAANTAETETPPSGAAYVVFKCDQDFWVCWSGGSAVVPASDVSDGTGSELNPTERYIVGISTFSIISAAASSISMAYYAE
jgi:hypothetical protein